MQEPPQILGVRRVTQGSSMLRSHIYQLRCPSNQDLCTHVLISVPVTLLTGHEQGNHEVLDCVMMECEEVVPNVSCYNGKCRVYAQCVMMEYEEVVPNVLCYNGICRGYAQCFMMAYGEVIPNVLCYIGICRGLPSVL